MPDIAAARVRWSNARRADPRSPDQVCRTYGLNLYEAVAARQTASSCKTGAERQKDLETLDAEIEAFNDLIANQCGR